MEKIFVLATLVLVLVLAACGSSVSNGASTSATPKPADTPAKPAAVVASVFPTGKFLLKDSKSRGLQFNEDGTFAALDGTTHLAEGTYSVSGPNCPPGPGYWPIGAPELPSDLGWRNPTHTIARRMLPAAGALGEVIVATKPVSPSIALWSAPPNDPARAALGELQLHAGERFALVAVDAGAEDARQTSALAYRLWYRIELTGGRSGWVQAAVQSNFETGSDGRPSSVYFNFLPATPAQ